MTIQTKSYSGAELALEVGGVEAGWVTGFQWTEDITQTPVFKLGNLDVIEYVPTDRRVSWSASVIKIRNESLKAQGIWPKGDTAEVLEFPHATWVLRGIIDDTVVVSLDKVACQSTSYSVSAGAIVMGDVSGMAVRARDESGD